MFKTKWNLLAPDLPPSCRNQPAHRRSAPHPPGQVIEIGTAIGIDGDYRQKALTLIGLAAGGGA